MNTHQALSPSSVDTSDARIATRIAIPATPPIWRAMLKTALPVAARDEGRSDAAAPVWAGGVVVVIGLISLLFFTSDAPPRAVIVNDTAARLDVFYCTDRKCRHGDPTTDDGP